MSNLLVGHVCTVSIMLFSLVLAVAGQYWRCTLSDGLDTSNEWRESGETERDTKAGEARRGCRRQMERKRGERREE